MCKLISLSCVHTVAPASSPQRVSITVLSCMSANVSWIPPVYEDRNGDIVSYTVEVETVNGIFLELYNVTDKLWLLVEG